MEKPLIFITNDDGYEARGFNTLIDIALKFGRVVAVAPERVQSGMGHAVTMANPLHLRKVREEEDLVVYACSGTPVDCVKLAFDMIMPELPALGLSGINHGANSATSVIYSGTMGAAIEASFYNIPSIGFSLTDHDPTADLTAAAEYAERVIYRVMHEEVEIPMCLNVNIPTLPKDEIKGVRFCRQAKGYWREEFVERHDPRGRPYYWLTGIFMNQEEESTETDEYALKNGYVSIVPIQIDMTDYRQLDTVSLWDF
ncbi:MAG: 5'/3'-nucleotidase SurE [Rikenellaceae bacterium]|jgi:5'-nucleotidase|nr:5'/3'-nucleotidase SurE [Rikenellaceae bacterium]